MVIETFLFWSTQSVHCLANKAAQVKLTASIPSEPYQSTGATALALRI